MTDQNCPNMPYRQLGQSGLKVSALSLGTERKTFGFDIDTKKACELIACAFDHGVNFFDTAEYYAAGKAEHMVGTALKQYPRDTYIVATKLFQGCRMSLDTSLKPNQTGLSRKHLYDGLNQSLKRLQLDYVDLLYCHYDDPTVPMVEIVTTMNHFIQQGKILYWGTSNWRIERLLEAYDCANRLGLEGPTMAQPEYNLLHRHCVEIEYQRVFVQHTMGTVSYSPLAGGLLTGKYNHGIPNNSRLHTRPQWIPEDLELQLKQITQLETICKDFNVDMTQLAIAWCLQNKEVSSVILGASNLSQLKHNLGAIYIHIADDLKHQIEKIFK